MLATRWLLLGLALLSGVALAQPSAGASDRSYQLYLEAGKAYRDGHAARAVELLNEAYRLKPEPVLLYNLARASEALGLLAEASDYYQRFLAAEPSAEDRGGIATRIASIQSQLKERERLSTERLALQSDLERARVPRVSPWAWVLGGVGVVSLGTGASLKVAAGRLRDDAVADPVHLTATATFGRARDFDTASTVLFIAGAVMLVGGVAWASVTLLTGHSAPRLALTMAPGSLAITWYTP